MAMFRAQFARLNRYQPPALVLIGIEEMGGHVLGDLFLLNSDPADAEAVVGRSLAVRSTDGSAELVMKAANIVAEDLLAEAILKIPQELRSASIVMEDATQELAAALYAVGHYKRWARITSSTNLQVLQQGVGTLFRGVPQVDIQPI